MMRDYVSWLSRSRYALLNLFSATMGASLVLLGTSFHGPGLSPDSVRYISVAQNLAHGAGYTMFDGKPMTLWPPLFPTVLAGFEVTGIDILQGARFLNAITFALVVFVAGTLLLRVVTVRWIAAIVTGGLALSVPLLESMVMVWSEPFFVLLVVCIAYSLIVYLQSPHSKSLYLLIVLLALACLQRYSGLGLVAGVAGVLAFAPSHVPMQRRWRRAIVVTTAAVVPICLWVLRNHWADGTLLGPRMVGTMAIGENIYDSAAFASSWLIPSMVPLSVRIATLVLLLVVFLLLLRLKLSNESHGNLGPYTFLIIAWIAVVYIGFILLSRTSVNIDPIDSRFLSPVLPLVLICAAIVVDLALCTYMRLPIVRTCAAAVLLLWFTYYCAWTNNRINRWSGDGIGIASAVVVRSPMLNWLAHHRNALPAMSNDPEAVYYVAGLPSSRVPLAIADPDPIDWSRMPPVEPYFVWFARFGPYDSYRLAQLSEHWNLVELRKFSDGAIFSVTAK